MCPQGSSEGKVFMGDGLKSYEGNGAGGCSGDNVAGLHRAEGQQRGGSRWAWHRGSFLESGTKES